VNRRQAMHADVDGLRGLSHYDLRGPFFYFWSHFLENIRESFAALNSLSTSKIQSILELTSGMC
jgi:hypothetical protein